MKVLIIFVVLSLINVIMSTIKSVLTVKSSKGVATIANAILLQFLHFSRKTVGKC